MDLQAGGRRRRGQELEEAILDAAWRQLIDGGYGSFTIDAVAERAETSRSVVYRRWADRDPLIAAALAHGLGRNRPSIPDTGSLRGDMIELLRSTNAVRSQYLPLLSVLISAHFTKTGTTFADLRAQMLGSSSRSAVDEILDRAVARGEADPDRLSPRVRTVAFDLFRHDLLLSLKAVPEADLIAIIDDVFLPLVRPPAATEDRST